MVNYTEIQDFIKLPCISLLWYTWNDTENVLEIWKNVLEKVLEKCLNFLSGNLYSPCPNFHDVCHRDLLAASNTFTYNCTLGGYVISIA